MKYYSESDLNSILDARDRRMLQTITNLINITFCRDCPDFISPVNGWGWCKAHAALRETPYYIMKHKDNFCRKGKNYE